MKANTFAKLNLHNQQDCVLLNSYQKIIKQPKLIAHNHKYSSLARSNNSSSTYIFNLKIKKADSLSIIHSKSNLLTKKYLPHHNKTEVRDQRGSTPYQERKMLQKRYNQEKLLKSMKSKDAEQSLNFLQTKRYKVSESLSSSSKTEEKLQKSNIRQTQTSAKEAKETENNMLTLTQQSCLDPVNQTISNSVNLGNFNRASVADPIKYKNVNKNVKISLKQLLKVNKSSCYQKRLLKTNESDLLKSIKVESKEKLYTQVPLAKNEDKEHFFSNQSRKERYKKSKSKIKSHIRHSKIPMSFMEEFICSAITIRPSNFEEKSRSLSNKKMTSQLSSKNNLVSVPHTKCNSRSALSKCREKSRRQKMQNSKSQARQFTAWEFSNDFSERQCVF